MIPEDVAEIFSDVASHRIFIKCESKGWPYFCKECACADFRAREDAGSKQKGHVMRRFIDFIVVVLVTFYTVGYLQ